MEKIVSVLLLTAMLAATGCQPPGDKVPQAKDSLPSQANEDRLKVQEQLSERLKNLDGVMADMKARAQQAGDKAKAEWEARRPDLEAQRTAAEKRLKELSESGKESWTETRQRTESALGELEKGFKQAWGRLTESAPTNRPAGANEAPRN